MSLLLCDEHGLDIGFQLGIILAFLFHRFAGYEIGSCLQPGTVTLTLKVLVSPVPVVLILVGLLILRTYPIDEEERLRNRAALQLIL